MLGANLAWIVLLGQIPTADPAALVSRLGSPRYAERVAAAEALERLGRPAIAPLRAARTARDAEVRSRASALVNKIEGALLTQPTLVSLDFEDRPLSEVVQAVSDQAEIKLGLFTENSPNLANRRITLHEPAPVPFWTAMDRLCASGRLQYNFEMRAGFPGSRDRVFALVDVDNAPRPSTPTSDSGPFRVSLLSLHYQRDVSFNHALMPRPIRGAVPPPPVPVAGNRDIPRAEEAAINEQFYAQIQVAAEPRLALSQNGPLRIIEAVDDRGQSLQPGPGEADVTERFSGYFGLISGSSLQLHAPLRHPEQPGQAIRTLRGHLPIRVATRKPDPLVIAFQGAVGKSFHNEEVDLSVTDIRYNPAHNQTNIDLVVRSITSTAPGLIPAGANGPAVMIQRPDMHQQQIDIVDAQGRVIPSYQSNLDAEGSRITLTLAPHDQATPTEIRYYSLAWTVTEVGFEFRDVPMP